VILLVASLPALGQESPSAWVGGSEAAAPNPGASSSLGGRDPLALPDLVLGTDSFRISPGQVEVEVANRGKAASPPARLRLTDRSPLAASEDGSPVFPRHRLLREERGMVIWPEPHADRLLLRVRWQGRFDSDTFSCRMRLLDAAGAPLRPLGLEPSGAARPAEITLDPAESWISWSARTGRSPAGLEVTYAASSPLPVLVVELPSISGALNLQEIFIGNWWFTRFLRGSTTQAGTGAGAAEASEIDGEVATGGRLTLPLEDPRLAHVSVPGELASGLWIEAELPPIEPGGSATVSFPVPEEVRRLFAQADAEDRIAETREGNNTASWKREPAAALVGLHTHASFSEGTASVDAQMDYLTRSGYDAVFWTDHDWRISGHGFPAAFGFEDGPSAETWGMVARRLDEGLEMTAAPASGRASEGTRALRLAARRRGEARSRLAQGSFVFRSWRGTIIRSLAHDLVLSFDLFPEVAAGTLGSAFIIRLELSDQPHVKRWLTYRILPRRGGAQAEDVLAPLEAGDLAAPFRLPAGRWTRVSIPIAAHAASIFPEGVDNNVSAVELGIEMESGEATWDLDRLALEGRTTGLPLLELQEQWVAAYPAIASHVSTEVSFYLPHLNPFTPRPILLDYDRVRLPDYVQATRREVERQNGAFSLNHPLGFGLRYPPRHVEDQLRHRLFGADLVEAGYRHRGDHGLADHLAFWDRALAAGVTASGVGVTDAHGPGRGNGFMRDENNFGTWVEADPRSRDSLIDGLLSGRLVFGDPLLFTGRITLSVDGAHGPGAVILGPGKARHAEFTLEGVPAGSRLELVMDGAVHASATAGEDGVARGTAAVPAPAGSLRAQSWDPRGEPLAFTNAVIFLPDLPPEGLPASRLRAAVAGREVAGEGRFRMTSFTLQPYRLAAEGSRGEGVLILEPAGGSPSTVATTDGVEAPFRYDAARDRLTLPLAPPGITATWTRPWWLRFSSLLIALALVAGAAFALFWHRRS
jgi:hypothetical protein